METLAYPELEDEITPTETGALRNVFLHVTKACKLPVLCLTVEDVLHYTGVAECG